MRIIHSTIRLEHPKPYAKRYHFLFLHSIINEMFNVPNTLSLVWETFISRCHTSLLNQIFPETKRPAHWVAVWALLPFPHSPGYRAAEVNSSPHFEDWNCFITKFFVLSIFSEAWTVSWITAWYALHNMSKNIQQKKRNNHIPAPHRVYYMAFQFLVGESCAGKILC